jgi:hypothetical protein
MMKVLTARFETVEAARNAQEDLIDVGYPSEKLYFDRANAELKVLTSPEGAGEARELLGRHRPKDIREHDA